MKIHISRKIGNTRSRNTRLYPIFEKVKSTLFNRLRTEIKQLPFVDYQKCQKAIKKIPRTLQSEFDSIVKKYPEIPAKQLRGYFYEALFYYACLKTQVVFLDTKIVEFEGKSPPQWLECVPLYDIKPLLFWNVRRRMIVPQLEGDFLVFNREYGKPVQITLLEVESVKPINHDWSLCIDAAKRCGAIFQIAYPAILLPSDLSEWVIRTPCAHCQKLSKNTETCSKCWKELL